MRRRWRPLLPQARWPTEQRRLCRFGRLLVPAAFSTDVAESSTEANPVGETAGSSTPADGGMVIERAPRSDKKRLQQRSRPEPQAPIDPSLVVPGAQLEGTVVRLKTHLVSTP